MSMVLALRTEVNGLTDSSALITEDPMVTNSFAHAPLYWKPYSNCEKNSDKSSLFLTLTQASDEIFNVHINCTVEPV